MHRPVLLLGILVMSGLLGCHPIAAPSAAEPPEAAASPPAGPAVPPAGITLMRADAKALNEIIAKHKGKVVFVDYWATWCGPCVEGFPHTVAWSRKYKDQGLATIAVSFDSLEVEGAVRDFLARQGADFDNLISRYDGVNQEAAIDFDVGPLPQYRLYDRQGKLRHKWEGKSDEIEPAIQKLLAEGA